MITKPTSGCCTPGATCATEPTDRAATSSVRRVEPTPTFRPSVDILETAEKFSITVDLPGVKPDGIELVIEQGVLTLKAAVTPRIRDGARLLLSEYGVGSFERSFKLGEGVDTERISAEFKNGVLSLTLPKAEQTKARKIEVRAS